MNTSNISAHFVRGQASEGGVKELKIYGSSDDLILVESGSGGCEEFYYRDGLNNNLFFSDGTLLLVKYSDEGIWRITPILFGSAEYRKTEGTNEDGSDVVTLDGDIDWVGFGSEWWHV